MKERYPAVEGVLSQLNWAYYFFEIPVRTAFMYFVRNVYWLSGSNSSVFL